MRIFPTLLVAGALGLGTTYFSVEHFPQLQHYKNSILPFVLTDESREIPNTQETTEGLHPVKKEVLANQRTILEDKIAELFITRRDNFGVHLPGGILLGKEETEKGNFFGRYTSYDPERTQEAVQEILRKAKNAGKRILIYEEGEGGYVAGIGVLPAARDIGNYFTENVLGPTIKGKVVSSSDKTVRTAEVQRLFREYARELHDRGVDAVLGPVLDVVLQEDEENILAQQDRQFGDRHLEIRKIAQLYVETMTAYGIKTIGKHFLSVGLAEEGDIHEEIVVNPDEMSPRRWAGQTYRVLKNGLQGVMLSHAGNPSDLAKPYSISRRAYEYLTREKYPSPKQEEPVFVEQRHEDRNFKGIHYQGLVVIDDISMRGLLDYIQTAHLTDRGRLLTAQARTPEARAAILAFSEGAECIITLHADLDEIVRAVASAYHADKHFAQHIEEAMRKYAAFAR